MINQAEQILNEKYPKSINCSWQILQVNKGLPDFVINYGNNVFYFIFNPEKTPLTEQQQAVREALELEAQVAVHIVTSMAQWIELIEEIYE